MPFFILFPVAVIKYPDKSNLGETVLFQLISTTYIPSLLGIQGSRDLKHLVTSILKSKKKKKYVYMPILNINFPLLYRSGSLG